MCLTCGCMIPNENHGDVRNIILDDIKAATKTEQAAGITPDEAVNNLNETWKSVEAKDKKGD